MISLNAYVRYSRKLFIGVNCASLHRAMCPDIELGRRLRHGEASIRQTPFGVRNSFPFLSPSSAPTPQRHQPDGGLTVLASVSPGVHINLARGSRGILQVLRYLQYHFQVLQELSASLHTSKSSCTPLVLFFSSSSSSLPSSRLRRHAASSSKLRSLAASLSVARTPSTIPSRPSRFGFARVCM